MQISPRKENENSREYAYRIIRQNIMTMQLLPGSVLSEAVLSEQLGMSRTPVHEALSLLKNEWLVDIFPQRGSSVSLIRIEYIKEGYAMRRMLEADIVRELAGHLSADQMGKLSENLQQQAQAANTGSYERPDSEFLLLDNQFHELLYHFGGYDRIWTAMHAVTSHYDRVRYLDTVLNHVDQEDILLEHRQIYNCLLIGIAPTVDLDAQITRHLGRFLEGFQHITDAFPTYFQ
jgi:DNA-binding GntR family transcriptional regulator